MSDKCYLLETRLINFQSWLDMSMKFINGLNVICATNNEGKSVFFKSLYLTTNPSSVPIDERTDFIRKGTQCAEVMHLFSDGVAYITKIYPKSNNYFVVEDLNNVNVKPLGTEVPKELLDRLGIILAGDMIANLIDDEQKMFMVNSDTQNNTTALDLLVKHDGISNLIDRIENERLPKAKKLLSSGKILKSCYETSVSQIKYKDVDSLERNVILSEKLLEPLNGLLLCHDKLETIMKVDVIDESVRSLVEVSNQLEDIYLKISNIENLDTIDSGLLVTTKCIESFENLLTSFSLLTKHNIIDSNFITITKVIKNLNDKLFMMNSLQSIPKFDSSTLTTSNSLNGLLDKINSIIENGDLNNELYSLKMVLETCGGEKLNCPIHGKIKFVDNECIPCNN